MKSAAYWIRNLELIPHPEGGYYRETYRAQESIAANGLPDRFKGLRQFSTAIYYLLEGKQYSKFHRLKSDEMWHFYAGTGLVIYSIDENGNLEKFELGADFGKGERLQVVIPAGHWFGAHVVKPTSYALTGCTVSPGFDFGDFETAKKEEMLKQYPKHKAIIQKLT